MRDLTTSHPAVRGLIIVVTVVAAAAVVRAHRDAPMSALLLTPVVLVYGALSSIDAAEQRLPNRLTLPLAGISAVTVLVAGAVRSEPGDAVGALVVGLLFAVVLAVMRFGMGDVKLALTVGTIAGWLGRDAVSATIVVGSLAGAATAMVLIIVHRRLSLTFSFGPFLALGSVAGMIVAGG